MGLFVYFELLIGVHKRADSKPRNRISAKLVMASLVVLQFSTHGVLAQKQAESQTPKLKCPYPNAGCTSFQELYQHRDPELLDDLSKDHDYVCFLPTKEDRFFVVWFTGPEQAQWRTNNDPLLHFFRQDAAATVVAYRNGIFDDEASGPFGAEGEWDCPLSSPDDCTGNSQWVKFTADKNQQHTSIIMIDNSAFTLWRSFTNQSNSKTEYSFVLQRSTGRFTERYSAENLHEENNGRCIAYRP